MSSLCSIMFCPGQTNVLGEMITDRAKKNAYYCSTSWVEFEANQTLVAISLVALAIFTAISVVLVKAAIAPKLPLFVGFIGITGLVAFAIYNLRNQAIKIQAAYKKAMDI